MPSYARMTDEDMRALWAYLIHCVEPVVQANKPTAMGFPFNLRFGLAYWDAVFADTRPFAPSAMRDAVWSTDPEIIFCELLGWIADQGILRIGDLDLGRLHERFRQLNQHGASSLVFTDGHDLVAYAAGCPNSLSGNFGASWIARRRSRALRARLRALRPGESARLFVRGNGRRMNDRGGLRAQRLPQHSGPRALHRERAPPSASAATGHSAASERIAAKIAKSHMERRRSDSPRVD